jgi:hypothetical protein
MAFARKIDQHTAELGSHDTLLRYSGAGDRTAQRTPSGFTPESRLAGAPLVGPGGVGCHLRYCGYLEGLLCHGYYPYTVKVLAASGPVAGVSARMRSDHRRWYHFYDVEVTYALFDDLPGFIYIAVRPILRKGDPASEPPRIRLNHIGDDLRDGGIYCYSHDQAGPYHKDHTTGEAQALFNGSRLDPGDPVRGWYFPGSVNANGFDFAPTLTRGLLVRSDGLGHALRGGWLFPLRFYEQTYLTTGWYCCLDLDGSAALERRERVFALWFRGPDSDRDYEELLDFEESLRRPSPITAELRVDDTPARVTVTNESPSRRKRELVSLPFGMEPIVLGPKVAGTGSLGVALVGDLEPFEARRIGTLPVRARYTNDREIAVSSRLRDPVTVKTIFQEEFVYDAKSFGPDHYLEVVDEKGDAVPYRMHLHRAVLTIPPGRSRIVRRNGSFAPYRNRSRTQRESPHV